MHYQAFAANSCLSTRIVIPLFFSLAVQLTSRLQSQLSSAAANSLTRHNTPNSFHRPEANPSAPKISAGVNNYQSNNLLDVPPAFFPASAPFQQETAAPAANGNSATETKSDNSDTFCTPQDIAVLAWVMSRTPRITGLLFLIASLMFYDKAFAKVFSRPDAGKSPFRIHHNYNSNLQHSNQQLPAFGAETTKANKLFLTRNFFPALFENACAAMDSDPAAFNAQSLANLAWVSTLLNTLKTAEGHLNIYR